MNGSREIIQMLVILGETTKETLSQERIAFMVSELEPHGADKVLVALKGLIRSAKRFPTICEVEEAMGLAQATSRDAALMLADRVFDGVARYGELSCGNTRGARAIEMALGPAAWELVMRQGGWNTVVDRAAEGGIFKAQLRDAADSYLKCGVIDRNDLVTEKLPSHFQALQAADEVLAQIEGEPYAPLLVPEPPF